MNRSFLAMLASLVVAIPVMAQTYVAPGKAPGTKCAKCLGKNTFNVPNKGLPTWPFAAPFVSHVGRYVDSTTTGNVQNLGIRTVRAGTVRVNVPKNRIYIALGEAVAGYALDTFFTVKVPKAPVAVSALNLGKTPKGRSPLETVAKPDSLFYAESPLSGWATQPVDAQRVLNDYDSDDRGLVYIGTIQLGWGIARDLGTINGSPMEFVAQVEDAPHGSDTVISLKTGGKYYAVISQNPRAAGRHSIYDVTVIPVPPAHPPLLVTRTTTPMPPGAIWSMANSGIVAWAKNDTAERLAIVDTSGHARIFSYAAFISGTAPIADYTPAAGKRFVDLSFDDSGTLWIAESGPAITANVLHRAKPTGAVYTKDTVNVYGGPFAPDKISAGGGYVVASGRAVDNAGVSAGEFRIVNASGATPALVPAGDFVRKYYYIGPSGYADPGIYVGTWGLRLVKQGTKTYLLYSGGSLGDVFELPAI